MVLKNARHEAFCRNVSMGMAQVDAYHLAGYKRHASNASALMHRRSAQADPPPEGVDGSLPLENPGHEAFAQALVRGATIVGAYQEAGYKPITQNASRLLLYNAKVRARVYWLKTQAAKAATEAACSPLVNHTK
jgi:hypothetical protein